ncbi:MULTISPECIES: nitroreductase family protein [Paenibacillus]|uniref:Nitroreductase n=2 Tax=Paenibacillus TaxID=44249 RepID=A0A0U2VNP8_9BACL|nr:MULTISPECIES: nitroreductase family protein [Paenibacillus]AKU19453.1 hypothetical protein [Paenibacillus sp. 32O-Y]ALS21143.1 nitroreductase [Paenibacillus naphthalenovorans]NTZ18636.1 nitroreductase [Paenibacillus sp. JMULE4]SDI01890.1 Nitroreductase [Paenibacillus naphthalenovorans]GCL71161.1 nitroreductase [Paenibacillus naphthalenovorans]
MSIKADWKNNELLEEVKANRTADYPVHPLFLNRWSARSYLSKPVSDETLYTVLEAARWAPSSSNLQPWRFIVANTEEKLEQIRSFLFPNNRLWADQAPVLIVIASTRVKENGDPQPIHSFDTGAAWAALSLQASLLGLSTRAMGGFDKEAARRELQVPDTFELHAVIALGYPGGKETLHESFRDRELPNGRRPLSESIVGDTWS